MKTAVLVFALIFNVLAVPNANAELIPSQDGKTVYDTVLHVNWLANANLAGTDAVTGQPGQQFGVSNINPNGSMDYATAVLWVNAMNGLNGGVPYLGHSDWTLPTSPHTDGTCHATGPYPYRNSFGFGCRASDMGSLFYDSLGRKYPNTAAPVPNSAVSPFSNLQPYLYWSETLDTSNPQVTNGYHTFSFNTGFKGSNVDGHYMYVLPMIQGKHRGPYRALGADGLEVSADGLTVYDPLADVTWLANADLAITRKFGAQCLNVHPDGSQTKCINKDGSMTRTTADIWIDGMKKHNGGAGWLGQTGWQLPPTNLGDTTCSINGKPKTDVGFFCTGSPMGELFYGHLGLSQGTRVVATPQVGPFSNVQPYLYWSSCEPLDGPSPCLGLDKNGVLVPADVPAPGFGFSFSFGNGFQGTDVIGNNLYVTAHYPKTADQIADTTSPLTTAGVSGPLGSNGWYLGPTVVNFTATDDLTGVFKTESSLDNGKTWEAGNIRTLKADGIHTILFRSIDFVGNVETPGSITVMIDSTAPSTSVRTHYHTIKGIGPINLEVDFDAFDNLSGVAKTEYSLDHGSTWRTGTSLFLSTSGTYTILFRSTDVAGNLERRKSITLTVVVNNNS